MPAMNRSLYSLNDIKSCLTKMTTYNTQINEPPLLAIRVSVCD